MVEVRCIEYILHGVTEMEDIVSRKTKMTYFRTGTVLSFSFLADDTQQTRHSVLKTKKQKNIYCTGGEKERAQQFDCPFSCYLDAIFRCSGSHLVDNLSIWLSNFLLLFLGVPLLCFLVFYIVTHLLQTQSKKDGPSAIYPAWCVST